MDFPLLIALMRSGACFWHLHRFCSRILYGYQGLLSTITVKCGCFTKLILQAGRRNRCVRRGRNGEEALEKLPEAGADVVITDMSLPGMNGVELVSKSGRRFPG